MIPQLRIKRILFATDFLESSRLALDYAVAFAEHFHATIVMVHVVELTPAAMGAEAIILGPSLTRRVAQQRLHALAAGVRRLGIEVEAHVEAGLPCDVVLTAVERFNADLLVLGVHGVHRGIGHLVIGSNTEKILLSARCPTLTVGAHVLTGVGTPMRLDEIIYFSDFTPEATAAAPYAVFFGKEFHAPIDVCQLLPLIAENNPRLQSELADEYCKRMKDVLEGSESDWCLPAFQLEHGMEIDQILDRAQSQNAGLIVLGVRTESQLGRHLHTSFAYHLLARATCPVLSVRNQGAPSLRPGA
jgi:nucleotide-binding universal stress UspA family protein